MRRQETTWMCDGCGKIVDSEEAARGWWYVSQGMLGSATLTFHTPTCIALWADPEPAPTPGVEESPE